MPRRAAALALLLALAAAGPPAAAPSAEAAPEVLFSPDGGVRTALRRQIDGAGATIDLAIFDFTATELADGLRLARARGVAVRIVADARQARGVHSVIPGLVAAGIEVRLVRGRGRGVMHNKFAVFDGRLVVTGSYNWTDSAEARNFENAIFLDDPVVVDRYATRFDRLFAGPAVTTGRYGP
jgi:phosphatidylserine/phosphatidylglycerophosphate/cardiolipin synthase-like enzyme